MWQRRWNIIVVRWRCLLTWTEALHLAGLASKLTLHSHNITERVAQSLQTDIPLCEKSVTVASLA